MKVLAYFWERTCNRMVVKCVCGKMFDSPLNRWRVVCKCGRVAFTEDLRKQKTPGGNEPCADAPTKA